MNTPRTAILRGGPMDRRIIEFSDGDQPTQTLLLADPAWDRHGNLVQLRRYNRTGERQGTLYVFAYYDPKDPQ